MLSAAVAVKMIVLPISSKEERKKESKRPNGY
jgi:hypothetical protein